MCMRSVGRSVAPETAVCLFSSGPLALVGGRASGQRPDNKTAELVYCSMYEGEEEDIGSIGVGASPITAEQQITHRQT